MWIIGLLLLAAAIVVGVEIGISNDRQVDVEAFSHVWSSNPAAAFLAGVITAVVGAIGLWLLVVGLRRSRVRNRRRRDDIAERDRLADERRREIEAMKVYGRNERGEREDQPRTVAEDAGDIDRDRDRERVSQIDRGSVDQKAVPDDEHDENEHRERRGLLHRSGR